MRPNAFWIQLCLSLPLLALVLAACEPRSDSQEAAAGEQASAAETAAVDLPDIEIPYEKFTLNNGLTVVVHEDRKAPIVAVNMWYHVGSKDEGPKQTGFAHLFEHLMFQGSEHWQGEYFEPFERAGATEMNGTTSTDRTNYFANVPTPALDMALWMESDRMGYSLGAVDQARLDVQRGVVLNEKKQRANQPYGEVWEIMPSNTYPKGHPYSWSTIGSEEDLGAATLEDVRAWFKRYYGPSNAVLVLAGDIDAEAAREKVTRYFGDIPAGPTLDKQKTWIAPMQGEHRQLMQDHVPQARVYKVWNVPPEGAPDTARLELVADLLAGSKTSRFYKRLVYEDRIATDVTAMLRKKEIGSQFLVWATAKQGQDLAEVEAALDEELARFQEEGPTAIELGRSKTSLGAGFLRGFERIGGFGGKSDILARGEVYQKDPGAYRDYLRHLREADAGAVRDTARKWLDEGVYVLEVHPFGKHGTTVTEVDRSQLPDIGKAPELDLPEIQRIELDNGLKVWLAERHQVPVVQFRMILDAGYAADPADAPGTASLALAMLDEGTANRDTLEISAELDRMGAQLSTSSSLDASAINLSALTTQLDDSLALYADVVRNPAFPERELARLKELRLAQIEQEKSNPTSLALRILGPLLYGGDHAYGVPLTGSGTTEAVEVLDVGAMKSFHERWVRPDNATLVVVGDTDMATLRPLLEKHFSDWRPAEEAAAPDKRLPNLEHPAQPRIYLRDRPGATQATVIAGNLAPPKSSPQDIPMTTVNAILGGLFNSRLNLNLREQKHWSYGVRSLLMDARVQQPFLAYASVQIDKTAPAMREMLAEIIGIQGEQPPRPEEIQAAQANLTRSLPGENETSHDLAGTFAKSVTFGLPDDYYEHYVSRVQDLGHEELSAAADSLLAPQALTWVVVGDLSKIEDDIHALGWGPVEIIDDRIDEQ